MIIKAVYANVRVYELQYMGFIFMRRHSDAFMKVNELGAITIKAKGSQAKVAYANKLVKNRVHERVSRAHHRLKGVWVPLDTFREIVAELDEELALGLAPLCDFEPEYDVDEQVKTEIAIDSEQYLACLSSPSADRTTDISTADGTRFTPPVRKPDVSDRESTPFFQFSSPIASPSRPITPPTSPQARVDTNLACLPTLDETFSCSYQSPCVLCSMDPLDYNALFKTQIAYNGSIIDPYSNRPLHELFLPHHHPVFGFAPMTSPYSHFSPSGTKGYVIDGLYSIDGIQQPVAPKNVDGFVDLTPWLSSPFKLSKPEQETVIPDVLLPEIHEMVGETPTQEQKEVYVERKRRPRR